MIHTHKFYVNHYENLIYCFLFFAVLIVATKIAIRALFFFFEVVCPIIVYSFQPVGSHPLWPSSTQQVFKNHFISTQHFLPDL